MKAFFQGLTTYCSSTYNTLVGTTVLTVGTNLFAGELPDQPDFAVLLEPDAAARDPKSKIRRPEFNLVVRTPKRDAGRAIQLVSDLTDILGSAVNPVAGHPCFIRSIQEPARGGYDAQGRIINVTRFVIWSVSL